MKRVVLATCLLLAVIYIIRWSLQENVSRQVQKTRETIEKQAPIEQPNVASEKPGAAIQELKVGFKKSKQELELIRAMTYLSEIAEIKWYEIEANTVYIGFDPLPDDWEIVIRGAALRGNQAIDFGCHVWAVSADKRGWRPGDSPFYGETTARYGTIKD